MLKTNLQGFIQFSLPTPGFAAMSYSATSLLLTGGFFQGAVSAASILPRDGRSLALPYADDTTKYCSWWLDYESVGSCLDMLEASFINLEEICRRLGTLKSSCTRECADETYRTLL